LAAAISDQRLNNVMLQYFRGANITSTFQPSTILPGPAPATVSQPDIEDLIRSLKAGIQLNGFDFGSTVFNFMLPRGTVLTIDDGGEERAPRGQTGRAQAPSSAPVEEKASSLEGLGGFHGSVQHGNQKVYYAAGV